MSYYYENDNDIIFSFISIFLIYVSLVLLFFKELLMNTKLF